MKCSNCGKEVPERAIVCGYCGTKVEKPKVEKLKPVMAKKARAEKAPVEDKLPKAKKFPVWVWAIVAAVVILAVLLIPRFGIDEQPSTVEVDEQPSSAEVGEDWVPVYWECEEEYIPADKSLILWRGWGAVTQEQIDDYYNTVRHSVYVNGEQVDILGDGFSDRYEEYDEFIDADIIVQDYWLDIGPLAPGEYDIITRVDYLEVIEDGFDTYGPGTGNEYSEQSCRVIVGD